MSDESKHSPEPWRAEGESDIEGADGQSVVEADYEQTGYVSISARLEWPWWRHPGNRARIIACVNACAGIPTEALESGALAKTLDACVALHEYEQIGGPFYVDWDKKFHAAVDALRALGRLK